MVVRPPRRRREVVLDGGGRGDGTGRNRGSVAAGHRVSSPSVGERCRPATAAQARAPPITGRAGTGVRSATIENCTADALGLADRAAPAVMSTVTVPEAAGVIVAMLARVVPLQLRRAAVPDDQVFELEAGLKATVMEKGPVTGVPASLLMATVGDVVSASAQLSCRRNRVNIEAPDVLDRLKRGCTCGRVTCGCSSSDAGRLAALQAQVDADRRSEDTARLERLRASL